MLTSVVFVPEILLKEALVGSTVNDLLMSYLQHLVSSQVKAW